MTALSADPICREHLIGRPHPERPERFAKPDDLQEVRELLETLSADRERVILMPEGTDRDVLRERSLWLAEICKDEGFRFSPRLHVELYGNQRGV